MRACSSGVSGGISRVSSRAGSPRGSDPSGSSRAARCPCIRCALTSAIAAATPPRSVSSISPVTAAGAAGALSAGLAEASAGGGGAGGAAGWPLPRSSVSSRRSRPGCEATRALSPLSNSSRHSARDGVGVLEIVLEQQPRVARVQTVDIVCAHSVCCTSGRLGPQLPSTADFRSRRRSSSRLSSRSRRRRWPDRRAAAAART